jgi:FolB domain-containing protein
MKIRIKDLRLKTVIGVNEWEREQKQEVVVNLEIEIDDERAAETDRIEDTINYKTISKRIFQETEGSQFFLIERLARRVLEISLEDKRVIKADVEVDKPYALRFAKSVSVRLTAKRGE